MPLKAVTSTVTTIPFSPGRKQLILVNEGPNDVRFGWESTVTANGTAGTDGCLLADGATLALGGIDLDITDSLKLIAAAGQTATVSYTERA